MGTHGSPLSDAAALHGGLTPGQKKRDPCEQLAIWRVVHSHVSHLATFLAEIFGQKTW